LFYEFLAFSLKTVVFPTQKISYTRISLVALLVVSYLHFHLILFSSCFLFSFKNRYQSILPIDSYLFLMAELLPKTIFW